jgi:hypothetical protein
MMKKAALTFAIAILTVSRSTSTNLASWSAKEPSGVGSIVRLDQPTLRASSFGSCMLYSDCGLPVRRPLAHHVAHHITARTGLYRIKLAATGERTLYQ